MTTTALPDNDINTELKARLHNMEIDGNMFKFYVSNVTSAKVKFYFLVGTQINNADPTKCGKGWENATEIQVITIFPKNTGSKYLMNEATNGLIQELKDFSLPTATGLKVNRVRINVENELIEETRAETVFRKIVRIETRIT